MRRALYILVCCAALLSGCRKFGVPGFADKTDYPNVTIGDLRYYFRHGGTTLADDVVIAGRVVSSDREGNFYNTFFIDDGTGAVEIMAGMPDLHATYHPGQRVVVHAKGLAVGWNSGSFQMGLPPEAGSGYATGYFYHRAVIRAYVSAERDIEQLAPIETDFGSLTTDMCGRLVRIEGVAVDPDSTAETWAATKPSPATGYVDFRTPDGDMITVMTSGYATFASMPLPQSTVALTGILLYGKAGTSKDHYLLKLRDEKDIDY